MGDTLVDGEFYIHQGFDIEFAVVVDHGAQRLKIIGDAESLVAFLDAEPAVPFGDVLQLVDLDGFQREDNSEHKAGKDTHGEQANDGPGDAAGVVLHEVPNLGVLVETEVNNDGSGGPGHPQYQGAISSLYHNANSFCLMVDAKGAAAWVALPCDLIWVFCCSKLFLFSLSMLRVRAQVNHSAVLAKGALS